MADAFISAEFKELKLTECGRERCSPLKNIVCDPKKWHLLHYVLYGKGTFILNGTVYNLEKGSIFYIPPFISPQYFPDKNEPWIYAWIGIEGVYADMIMQGCGLSAKSPIFYDKKLALKNYFNDLADRYNNAGELNMDCMSAALKIFWEMVNLDRGKSAALDVKQSHVYEARRFIANNYQFNITISDIAQSLGLTPNYLANIFSQILNTSPKQYLTQFRIDRACYLLTSDKLLIKDIAASVGYKNQLHFSAEFKRLKGVSPQEYRHKNKL